MWPESDRDTVYHWLKITAGTGPMFLPNRQRWLDAIQGFGVEAHRDEAVKDLRDAGFTVETWDSTKKEGAA